MRVFQSCFIGILTLAVLAVACTTPGAPPAPLFPKEPPPYVQVPHPQGLDQGDLMAIFVEKGAPDPATLAECDRPLRLLREKTSDANEWLEAARELVQNEPVAMHWCFYGKLYGLEARLKSLSFLDERQNWIIREFQTLTPLARAFQKEYQDTRYLRWAVNRYRTLSEWVFYRKLELSVDGIAALGPQALNPWGKVRPPKERIPGSVLERYGVLQSPELAAPGVELAALPAAPTGAGRSPASAPSPVAAASPEPAPSPVAVASPEPAPSPVAVASPEPAPSPVAAASPLPEATPAAALAPAVPTAAPAAEVSVPAAPAAAALATEPVPTVPLPLEVAAEAPVTSPEPATRAPASPAEATPAPAVIEAVAPAPADLGPAQPIEQISLPQ